MLLDISRFGLLLGLGLWLGASLTMLITTPVLFQRLERPDAGEVAGEMLRRVDLLLMGAIGLIIAGFLLRFAHERVVPGLRLAVPVVIMIGSRFMSALVVSPAVRALRARMRDANAPASDAERAVFGRLHGTSMALMVLELALAVYVLFVVA